MDLATLSRPEIARRLAAVPGQPTLPFATRVEEVVALGRLPHEDPLRGLRPADVAAVDAAIARTGIEHLRGRDARELSLGERQLVFIALAVAQGAPLLILDEPTVHLDLRHQVAVMELLADLNERDGVAVIAVLHDLGLAAHFFPRLALIDGGGIVADGTPREVLTPERIRGVFGVDPRLAGAALAGGEFFAPTPAAGRPAERHHHPQLKTGRITRPSRQTREQRVRIITGDNVADFVRDGALHVDDGWTLAPSALEYLRRNGIRFSGEESRRAAAAAASNLAVITVEGLDKPGIIANVAMEVARQHGNITDLSQTILAGVFVMVMVVDMSGTAGYDALVAGLTRIGTEIGVEINVRLYSVFEAMHRILTGRGPPNPQHPKPQEAPMARGLVGMDEILESVGMVGRDHFDIRTVTLGVDLRGVRTPEDLVRRVVTTADGLVATADTLARETGIPIVNRRIAVTPIAWVAERPDHALIVELAKAMDEAAHEVGVDFIGGLSALVEKHASRIDEALMAALPEALATTRRVCASVNVASTHAGINMDAVRFLGEVIKETASRTADAAAIGCAKLVIFANAVPDNPFMAGAFHGFGEGDAAISVGISGPGVIARALHRMPPDAPMHEISEEIKRTVFKITRVGEHVGREVARRLGHAFGIVDISLAPTSTPGDSVGEVLELIGVERVGLPGTTAALAMLNDAVKKGGAMATSRAGGLSGAFIPVSEDANMASAAADGHLSLEKLEAMTAVCSVGLDMIALPGTTSAATISAIIADEAAIGVINRKTTACRLIPVPGAVAGEWVDWGGLLGRAPVMEVRDRATVGVVTRAGHIPPPLQGLTN